MNKKNIEKLKFFISGLKSRFDQNSSIFKNITVIYTVGLKQFKGIGEYQNSKINYNFNGKSTLLDINSLFDVILTDLENYDSITLTYRERGTIININADNKDVKMTSKEVETPTEDDSHSSKSTLLNRNYLIKVGPANSLLKAIGIMSKNGKILNDKIRKYNQIDHFVELIDNFIDKLSSLEEITILDCGCGKSYLSFVLNYYLTEVKKVKCNFIGIDISENVITASKEIAKNLDYRNMEFLAMDIKDYKPKKKINLVISLHACDTATDMALAVGIKVNADFIIAVPCCHRELLNQYSYEPFREITKYGVLKARIADTLTDGMRGLLLESKGYDVSIVEYISPLETPKNILIRAEKTSKDRPSALKEYKRLCEALNVTPSLYKFIEEQWKA